MSAYVDHLFVYAGVRFVKDRMYDRLVVLNADGKPTERLGLYPAKAKHHLATVGGIYRGASFDDAMSVRGLNRLQYTGKLDDPVVMEWEAEEQAARVAYECARAERTAKSQTEIERTLTSLRVIYQQAARFGNYAKQDALERAVVRALRKPVKGGG